jgi:hypothetical protein
MGVENLISQLQGEMDVLAMEIWGRPVPRDGFCVCHGEPVDMASFRDDLSRKEFRISKLCQVGQDDFFGAGDED